MRKEKIGIGFEIKDSHICPNTGIRIITSIILKEVSISYPQKNKLKHKE